MEGKRKRHTSVVSGNEKGLWLQIETETMKNHGNGHVILEPIFYTCGKKNPPNLTIQPQSRKQQMFLPNHFQNPMFNDIRLKELLQRSKPKYYKQK
jgi:hypothetical protein